MTIILFPFIMAIVFFWCYIQDQCQILSLNHYGGLSADFEFGSFVDYVSDGESCTSWCKTSGRYEGYATCRGRFWNCSKRTIKFIYVTMDLYNCVGDYVDTVENCTFMGPIKPNKHITICGGGSCNGNLAASVKVKHITVEYMDGDVVTIR